MKMNGQVGTQLSPLERLEEASRTREFLKARIIPDARGIASRIARLQASEIMARDQSLAPSFPLLPADTRVAGKKNGRCRATVLTQANLASALWLSPNDDQLVSIVNALGFFSGQLTIEDRILIDSTIEGDPASATCSDEEVR